MERGKKKRKRNKRENGKEEKRRRRVIGRERYGEVDKKGQKGEGRRKGKRIER